MTGKTEDQVKMTEKTEDQVKMTGKTENQENPKQGEDKTPKQEEDKTPKQGEDNIIYIGIKPFMNYVTGVVMQFKNKKQKEVIVSARGKFTSKAIDVVEVAKRNFLKDENVQVKDIKISSEAFENKEGKRIHVSAIEIHLIKE